tara:strand:- start:40 stop:213 length:174 start_codon:yes stop_codon:yes gene_type:complete
MKDIKNNPSVQLLIAKEKIKIAKMGLKAIIEQSADISSNRQIAEKTIEHMDNLNDTI